MIEPDKSAATISSPSGSTPYIVHIPPAPAGGNPVLLKSKGKGGRYNTPNAPKTKR